VQQHELRPALGAKRARKRVGRGNASGTGTYAGKGIKGQQARAGSGPRPGFEGGQTPLIRRLPVRRGFHNRFRVEFTPVNLRDLARLPAGSDVTPDILRDHGVVRTLRLPIKLLGTGDVTAALTVRAHRVSASARAKIEAAGGTVEELLPRKTEKRQRKAKRAKAAAPEAPASAEAGAKAEESDDSDSETVESKNAADVD
jgi:large subunit ribosomal protein L15